MTKQRRKRMSKPQLKKILYVEDEEDIRTIARMALEMVGGLAVEVCSSGQEALTLAPAFEPDLILLDVMMPGMDGPETFAQLQQLPDISDTPVVFMTAKVQPQEIRHYRELGAADVIRKPFDPMTLTTAVQTIWSKLHN
jgi:two-component system, OmpR family, response regulator